MTEALRFFRAYEIWIYLLLALGGLIYIRKFILSWEELRGAAFGLERESAQSRLNQAAGMMVLLLMMAIAVFVLVSFVAPSFPSSNPLLTPTLDVLATPTNSFATILNDLGTPQGAPASPAVNPTQGQTVGEDCIPEQIMISEPTYGSEVSGVIQIKGTANVPNFGFYKYEIARPGETVWLTIQAGREIKQESELGQWDTRTFSTGDYMLRLVVTDNEGSSLPPCVIQVRVNNPVVP